MDNIREVTALNKKFFAKLIAAIRETHKQERYGGVYMEDIKTAKKTDGHWYELRQAVKQDKELIALLGIFKSRADRIFEDTHNARVNTEHKLVPYQFDNETTLHDIKEQMAYNHLNIADIKKLFDGNILVKYDTGNRGLGVLSSAIRFQSILSLANN